MAAFLQNQNDAKLGPEEKLSLAVGGWLLGADTATPNLEITLSAWRLHRKIREYLAEPLKIKRERMLPYMLREPAAQPEIVAAMAARMAPPFALPEPMDEKIPGYYKEEVSVTPAEPTRSTTCSCRRSMTPCAAIR